MAVVIALVVMINTLLMRVLEQTHEIKGPFGRGMVDRPDRGHDHAGGINPGFSGGVTGLALGVGGLHW